MTAPTVEAWENAARYMEDQLRLISGIDCPAMQIALRRGAAFARRSAERRLRRERRSEAKLTEQLKQTERAILGAKVEAELAEMRGFDFITPEARRYADVKTALLERVFARELGAARAAAQETNAFGERLRRYVASDAERRYARPEDGKGRGQ